MFHCQWILKQTKTPLPKKKLKQNPGLLTVHLLNLIVKIVIHLLLLLLLLWGQMQSTKAI